MEATFEVMNLLLTEEEMPVMEKGSKRTAWSEKWYKWCEVWMMSDFFVWASTNKELYSLKRSLCHPTVRTSMTYCYSSLKTSRIHTTMCVFFSGDFVDLLVLCDLMPFKWRIWFTSQDSVSPNLIQQIQLIKRHPIKQHYPIFVEVLFLQSPCGSSPYVSVHQHVLIILFYGHPGCLSFLSTRTWFWHLRIKVLMSPQWSFTPQTDFSPPSRGENLCGVSHSFVVCIFF